MKKMLLTALTLASMVQASESCYILAEPTVGTYSQDTLSKIQSNKNLAQGALQNALAVELRPGMQFCDTGVSNWSFHQKKVQLKGSGALLWIIDTTKAEAI